MKCSSTIRLLVDCSGVDFTACCRSLFLSLCNDIDIGIIFLEIENGRVEISKATQTVNTQHSEKGLVREKEL